MFVSLQHHPETRTSNLQEGHRGHLHVVLLQTEPPGTRRGETGTCTSVALPPPLSLILRVPSFPQIHTSLINGRPGADDLTPELLNFTSARYIRLRLQRIRTLNADLMTLSTWDPRDIDPIVTRRVRRRHPCQTVVELLPAQLTPVALRSECGSTDECGRGGVWGWRVSAGGASDVFELQRFAVSYVCVAAFVRISLVSVSTVLHLLLSTITPSKTFLWVECVFVMATPRIAPWTP